MQLLPGRSWRIDPLSHPFKIGPQLLPGVLICIGIRAAAVPADRNGGSERLADPVEPRLRLTEEFARIGVALPRRVLQARDDRLA